MKNSFIVFVYFLKNKYIALNTIVPFYSTLYLGTIGIKVFFG